MMKSLIENLCKSAAGDGALTPVGAYHSNSELDALMDAWSRERQTSIECLLALEEAGRLLRELMDEDGVPLRIRRRAKRLVRAIRASREAK